MVRLKGTRPMMHATRARDPGCKPDGPSKIVLIIEEPSITRRAMECLFRHCGWTVATATTLEQALTLLEMGPGYIIVDLMLCDGEGETILRAVKNTSPLAWIIATTGGGDRERYEQDDQHSPHALLRKPLNISTICSAVIEREAFASSPRKHKATPAEESLPAG
ncbi:response regulator [Singulisphaera sp. PoT]|uniref:response regulator n=1 Tax=Singulisphaera sp. PoT TaxID=3411797 RepID=UPI003BF53E8D